MNKFVTFETLFSWFKIRIKLSSVYWKTPRVVSDKIYPFGIVSEEVNVNTYKPRDALFIVNFAACI